MPRRRSNEAGLERWAVARARNRRWVVSKVTDPTGFPDHVFWVPGGRPLIVEFKDEYGRTEPGRERLQRYYRRKLSGHGYLVEVVTTKAEFLEAERRALAFNKDGCEKSAVIKASRE